MFGDYDVHVYMHVYGYVKHVTIPRMYTMSIDVKQPGY
jgi:hypothetical protein